MADAGARKLPGRQDWKKEYEELSERDRRSALEPASRATRNRIASTIQARVQGQVPVPSAAAATAVA